MTTLKIKPDFMDIFEIVEIISYLNNVLERKISEKKKKDEEKLTKKPHVPSRFKKTVVVPDEELSLVIELVD
jgi:hypothetical protein